MSRKIDVVQAILDAAIRVQEVPDRKPWDYGWCDPGYRRSDGAALKGPRGSATIPADVLPDWEDAVERLAREPAIQARWSEEEFWGIVGSLTVALHYGSDPSGLLASSLERLRKAPPALTLQLVANVIWDEPPMAFGNVVLGKADKVFLQLINDRAGAGQVVSDDQADRWFEDQIQPRLSHGRVHPVALACWTPGQSSLALSQSERNLRDLVDLVILLERDLPRFEVFRRGATNRPGIRGLTLERGSVQSGMKGKPWSLELASMPVLFNAFGVTRTVKWYGAEPVPLGAMLAQPYLREAVSSCLANDPLSLSVRVAARWFSESHFTGERDHSTLALGVSMDALVSGKKAMPGGALADRYAFLSGAPAERLGRRKEFNEFYSIRSAIAHGGKSSKIEQDELIDRYRQAVRETAWRIIALRDQFQPQSSDEVDGLFDDLRLGVRTWV
ncbi:hypothetical protein GCM10009765_66550 [Fodinicola feengrottensis]|uniref:Apea-like HEPN domain-containing protein n=1 Tax=Fodinicola feengrottensis TaxID=435914 RepID=A0ABP4UPM5_9ACTN